MDLSSRVTPEYLGVEGSYGITMKGECVNPQRHKSASTSDGGPRKSRLVASLT